ncbi:thiosulfate oxidation carrier complex protein SoxZ [Aestuariirhabdus sp. Z084]|uniref:thiosulfate oxidation carrier complex protein SoxZ n=1 Tax=Aestuariirhabdus haliotis TaxID=2918751 RepID=UPI00201B402F|nr:thiosulfate oxidation carrier complex protein SoxZ [Aestuariirhabdus haliotis]MCL6415460.1 thiosulfate oxidation carrier complex protein SoxZ [Aestuariirhabdus haliotis]MCL6419335.1 thiosulfate oxidation carrier complex protein SoxZ [Aestuariirhabdus haliotis]
MDNRLHIKVPSTAKKGQVVQLKTKLDHLMESGWRNLQAGGKAPKHLIGQFVCFLDEVEVFRAELDAGMADNPYLAFFVRVESSGQFRFVWSGEQGERYERSADIIVS